MQDAACHQEDDGSGSGDGSAGEEVGGDSCWNTKCTSAWQFELQGAAGAKREFVLLQVSLPIPDEVKGVPQSRWIWTSCLGGYDAGKDCRQMFREVMKRNTENRVDPIRSKFGKIKKEEIDLSGTMQEVEHYISEKNTPCSERF